jgi:hypothetical protein
LSNSNDQAPPVVAGGAGVGEGDDRERGVPHGRLAGLEPALVAVVDDEALEAGQPTGDDRVVERAPADGQRDEGVDPWRLDPAPRAVGLLAVDDPLLHPGR